MRCCYPRCRLPHHHQHSSITLSSSSPSSSSSSSSSNHYAVAARITLYIPQREGVSSKHCSVLAKLDPNVVANPSLGLDQPHLGDLTTWNLLTLNIKKKATSNIDIWCFQFSDFWVLRCWFLQSNHNAHLGTFAFCDGTAQDQQMRTFSCLTTWMVCHIPKINIMSNLSKLFKLFQILDAVRVDYMSNMQKLVWSQECCTKKTNSSYPHSAIGPWNKSLNCIFPIKYVIPKSLKVTHWLSQYHHRSTQSLTLMFKFRTSWKPPKPFRCHGRLGRNVFFQKSDDCEFELCMLCSFWAQVSASESTLHQSQDQTCSTLLLRFWSDQFAFSEILWNQVK